MQRMLGNNDALVQHTVGELRAYTQRKEWYAAKIYKLELESVTWIVSQINNSYIHVLQNLRSMYVRRVAAAAVEKRVCDITRK